MRQTALLAIAAARVGDPLAPDLAAYVEGERDTEAVHPLEELAYASRALVSGCRVRRQWSRTPSGASAERRTSAPAARSRSPSRRRSEPSSTRVAGDASAVASCDGTRRRPSRTRPGSAVAVTRVTSVAGPVPAGSLVTIELHVTFDAPAPSGLYRAVERSCRRGRPTGEPRAHRPATARGGRPRRGCGTSRGRSSATARSGASGGRARPRTTRSCSGRSAGRWPPALHVGARPRPVRVAPTIGASVPASDLTVLAP